MALSEETFGQFLHNAFGEPYLPALVRESFSQVGSQAVYERGLGKVLAREKSMIIFVGSDGGLLLRYLQEILPQKGSRLLVVEFPELLVLARRQGVIPETLPKHLTVCAPDELPGKSRELGIEDYYRMDSIFLTQSNTVELGLHPEYRRMWKEANLFLVRLKFEMYNSTGTVMNFLTQTLKNLPDTRYPANLLDGLFAGRTAILLAGGPSLADILPWAKANRDKLVVLAVARLAHLLAEEGIVPDLYFSVDPYDLSFFNCREMLVGTMEPVLVGTYHMNARLLGQWGGRFLYIGDPFPWESPLNPKDNAIFMGTTVAHQAVGLAVRMGFARVILAGVDLCFSKEGITHTQGTLESKMGPWIPASDLQVETNGGWMAETWYDLYYDIPSMGKLAAVAAERGCMILNPAPAAAKIPHVQHLSLAEIALAPLEESPRQRIGERLPRESSRERLAHYKRVVAELNRAMAEARQIRKLAQEALSCNDRLFGRHGEGADFQAKKRMDAIEELLNKRHPVMTNMVRKVRVESFLGLSNPDREREWSDQEVEELGNKYYQYHVEGVDALLALLEKTRARLASRMDEERAKPDLTALSRQWLADDQPGRYRVFLARRALQNPPDAWREGLAVLQQQFQEHLTTQDSCYRKQFDDMLTPTAVLSKVMGFFQDKDGEKLRNFANGLRRSVLENTDQFLLLIQGCIHDLENDPRKAAQSYRQITLPLLQEEAMRGILTLALREGDLLTARAVAGRLAIISPIFHGYLGEILRISGDLPGALAALERFSHFLPDDPVTLIKMARIQVELGQWAEGEALLRKVLAKYPQNQAAAAMLALLASQSAALLPG